MVTRELNRNHTCMHTCKWVCVVASPVGCMLASHNVAYFVADYFQIRSEHQNAENWIKISQRGLFPLSLLSQNQYNSYA